MDYVGIKLGSDSRTNAKANAAEPIQQRLLSTLEQLLAISGVAVKPTLDQASDLVAKALRVEQVDAFLYDPQVDTLVALGSSNSELSRLQRRLGMDRLPLSNGGRIVEVFQTGVSYCTGHADQDQVVLPGFRKAMEIKSMAAVVLPVAGDRRGVVQVASTRSEAFSRDDLSFLEAVANWIGTVVHRAELVESISKEAAEQARRTTAEELITTLAHDLRNYVTPLKGRLGIVRSRALREQREPDIRDTEAMLRTVDRLNGLITDLLDTARIEQGIVHISPQVVDLVALAESVLEVLRSESVIRLRAPDELCITADPVRVRQALENLLANAIKYSPSGVAVILEIKTEEGEKEEGQRAAISVRDEGPGIPSELMPNLFTRFATGLGSNGLGLGLYMARSIAEAHGGTLTVEETNTTGTTFKMTLPVH